MVKKEKKDKSLQLRNLDIKEVENGFKVTVDVYNFWNTDNYIEEFVFTTKLSLLDWLEDNLHG